jgi:FtsH-binding integral membrane protein
VLLNFKKNKYRRGWMLLLSLVLLFIPSVAYAADAEESYEYMNTILYISVGVGGFLVIFSIISAGIKLASAQNNPANRTQGIIGLAFALLGGYMVYKSVEIAGWFSGFGL